MAASFLTTLTPRNTGPVGSIHDHCSVDTDHSVVNPHGRAPWFVRAGRDVADRLNPGRKSDGNSIRSGASSWHHERIGSKGSNREMDTMTIKPNDPTDPRLEKVLRKL